MSKELREIAAAYRECARAGKRCALATLVRVEGSSFRRPGARMLIGEGGEMLGGCVSAGCLEADVAEWGVRVMASGKPKLVNYSARDDGADAEISLAVMPACNGIIDILIEPLTMSGAEPIELPMSVLDRGQFGLLATVYRCDADPGLVGARLLVGETGELSGAVLREPDARVLAEAAREQIRDGSTSTGQVQLAGGSADAMFEQILMSPRVLICGGGPGAPPLSRIADLLGWRVILADHRPAYLSPERFPADAQIVLARPDELLGCVEVDARTACVVMTHIDSHDRDLLAALSGTNAFYVGVLGSRRRIGGIVAELQDEGCDVPGRLGPRFHSPVGLDLGGTDPDAIALSIVAEVQASLTGRSGGRLTQAG